MIHATDWNGKETIQENQMNPVDEILNEPKKKFRVK